MQDNKKEFCENTRTTKLKSLFSMEFLTNNNGLLNKKKHENAKIFTLVEMSIVVLVAGLMGDTLVVDLLVSQDHWSKLGQSLVKAWSKPAGVTHLALRNVMLTD